MQLNNNGFGSQFEFLKFLKDVKLAPSGILI